MGFFSWFSADVDTGKKEYENMEEFIKDNPSYVRDKEVKKVPESLVMVIE